MSDKHLVVCFIVVAMAIWMFSGELEHNRVTADEPSADIIASDDMPVLVRGIRSEADSRTIYLEVRGQTRANRIVQVKSEIAGRIEEVPGEKGRFVKTDDVLCRIAVDSRRNEYNQALAELRSAQLEFDGFEDLNRKGLQSEVVLAKARAALEQSRTRAKQTQLALEKTEIRAPFGGVVSGQQVEVGDVLAPGATCVSLMEVDPMLVAGQVAEKNIQSLSLGDEVKVKVITGQELTGTVSYIGHAPDLATRTFPVEVTIPNPGALVRAGLTSEMHVPVGTQSVHLISPAALVLHDSGTVGVRIVDETDHVRFVDVTIVDEGPEGVWVAGLPQVINLITVGQEEVFEGQMVRMDFSSVATLVSG